MSDNRETVDRYPDGKIPASRRYIDYGGQLVIRTRYGTIQRWTKSGWDGGRGALAPYILTSDACRAHPEKDPMNAHLAVDEFDVYYVDDGETEQYRVATDDEPTADREATV